jgi:hypothetical protein
VKFGPDGTQRWAYRYNGPGNGTDLPSAVVVDDAGNAYVTGSSYGQGFDWATLKFAPDGALLWERRLTGAGFSNDGPAGMVRLPDGNLVAAGVTQNTGDGETSDAEAVAYDPQGAIVWRARWSDTAASHELVTDLDVDASGRIAMTGTTAPLPGPYVVPVPVTLRFDGAGGLLQTIRGDGGTSVDLDPAGNLHLAGLAEDGTPSVAKYDASGRRLWGGPLTRAGSGLFLVNPFVAADSTGAVTVASTARGASFSEGGYQTIRFAADGRELSRHLFDGRDDPGQHDQVAALTIDSRDVALVTGTSWNGYGSLGGTALDFVTLRFAGGATPAPTPTLLAPSRLEAAAQSRSQIRLRWQDNSAGEDGFRIERCAGAGCTDFALLATVGRDVTGHLDDGLARNTTYTYRVRAFDANGASAFSDSVAAKTRRN